MAAPNSTLGSDTYVPIVKAKQGELGALATIDAAIKPRVLPLIEVREGSSRAHAIATSWSRTADIVFVHAINLDEADDTAWAIDVGHLFEELAHAPISAVPVATPDDPPELVATLADVVAHDGRGACIRLDGEQIALEPPATVNGLLDELVRDLGLTPDKCDLVVDVGEVRDSIAARVATAEAGMRAIAQIGSWRNVIVAFSAFPESVGEIAAHSAVTQISRDDAIAYAALANRAPERMPVYSDYGVGVPFYADIPWAPVPAIKYTESANWQVHRGATRQNRSPQYVQLCEDIVVAPYFDGAAFSEGDRYIEAVAGGLDGPGNPMTFVRAAMSRHIACVADRLATLGVP